MTSFYFQKFKEDNEHVSNRKTCNDAVMKFRPRYKLKYYNWSRI